MCIIMIIRIYIYIHDAASQVPPLPPMGMGIQELCSLPPPLWVGGVVVVVVVVVVVAVVVISSSN